jgi:periplasmic divalent cation tolerance protein
LNRQDLPEPSDGVKRRAEERHVSEKHAIVVLVTTGSADESVKIARSVVEERLAACVNIVPGIRSNYRWEGRVADEAEWLLVMKTSRAGFGALETRVRELHSYDVPEVIALDVAAGSRPYLDWLLGSVG